MKHLGMAIVLGALLLTTPAPRAPRSLRAPQAFRVTSVQLAMSPTTLKTWRCGAFIQVVYHATFTVSSGASGGTMSFSWTTTNGRGQTNAQLTILPGQTRSEYTFTWQGALSPDHVVPGVANVRVMAPNTVEGHGVYQSAGCR